MSDYLWDHSGEPDAHVKQLEEALAPLRYQRQPLQLPAHINHKPHPHWLPLAAATVSLAILTGVGGMLYRNFRQSKVETPAAAITNDAPPDAHKRRPAERAAHERSIRRGRPNTNPASSRNPLPDVAAHERQATSRVPLRALHGRKLRTKRIMVAREAPPAAPRPDQMRDGEFAKEQLLLALRITSRKLDLAQRRMQEANHQPAVNR